MMDTDLLTDDEGRSLYGRCSHWPGEDSRT